MRKLLVFVATAASAVVAVTALVVPAASAQPTNKLQAVADCGEVGTFETFVPNTKPFSEGKISATGVSLAGPGAGVVFGEAGATYRGGKAYTERGFATKLAICDITVYTPAGPAPTAEDVQVLLSGNLR